VEILGCKKTAYDEAVETNAATCGLSKRLHAAIFLSIGIVVLAGGCNHAHSTPEDTTAVTHKISQALVGKQITIRGKFSLLGKIGPYVVLDNLQEVYLNAPNGSFEWGKPYTEMDDKLIVAAGTLRFHRSLFSAERADAPVNRQLGSDYFYFEAESVQLRIVSP
jgi:hypothetical protein